MNKTKIAKTLMAAMIGSALISGSALADESMSQKASQTADSAGSKIDSSMKKSMVIWMTAASPPKPKRHW